MLVRQKLQFEAAQKREETLRQSRLKAFLDAHHHASQWQVCLAALVDAHAHGVTPTDAMIEGAMRRCGARGKLAEAKRLYTRFYKEIQRPRPLSAHVTFLEACAACGEYAEAKKQLDRLVAHDVRRFRENPSHCSAVTDDLVTAYLRAALSVYTNEEARHRMWASPRTSSTMEGEGCGKESSEAEAGGDTSATTTRSSPSSSSSSPSSSHTESTPRQHRRKTAEAESTSGAREGDSTSTSTSTSTTLMPVWEVALRDLVQIRNGYPPSLFRQRVELTPLLLECAAQLADAGDQWAWALRLLRSAASQQVLVPPEAYDAAIRVCYRHHRHAQVVDLLQTMIATKATPDERSVRLGIVSSEEVEADSERSRLIMEPGRGESGDSTYPPDDGKNQRGGADLSTVAVPLDSPLSRDPEDLGGMLGRTRRTTTPADDGAAAWALSLKLFQSLRLNGLPLYQQSYEAPLRTCVMAGQWERAMRLLREMRRDGRPISTSLFRLVVACRMEHGCADFAEVRRLLDLPSLRVPGRSESSESTLYLAAMRWCVRHQAWGPLEKLSREMQEREMPETYQKILLLIEAAYHQGKYHAVLARFARFHNITRYEQQRVERDGSARMHPEDFSISEPLLEMVLSAYRRLVRSAAAEAETQGETEKGKDAPPAKTKRKRQKKLDPVIEVAYHAALETMQRLYRGGSAAVGGKQQVPEWAFSRSAREESNPPSSAS